MQSYLFLDLFDTEYALIANPRKNNYIPQKGCYLGSRSMAAKGMDRRNARPHWHGSTSDREDTERQPRKRAARHQLWGMLERVVGT